MRSIALFIVLFTAHSMRAQEWNWAVSAGGGGNTDLCYGIATDSEANAYWVGTVSGTADFGCATLAPGNTIAGVLAKYDASGACQWVRGITTTFYDAWVYGIAIDAQDRIYITGSCQGTTDFGNGISLPGSGSSDDLFTARYDVDGTCIWAKRITNSTSSSEGRGIALDEQGDIYVTGFAGGSGYAFGDITVNNGGFTRQSVIVKYDSTGTALWAKSTNGSAGGRCNARGISVAGDRLFITGQVYFATTSYQGLPITAVNNTSHAFVLACDLQGAPLWARSFGGGDNEGFGIVADTLGNLFVAGRMWGSLYLSDDTLTSVSDNDDILLMGMDQDGDHRWAKSTGSVQRDLAWGITTDGMGNAYVAAQFNFTVDFFGTPLTALGSEDALIAKLDADGDVVWVQRPSGFQRDIPVCIHRQAVTPNKLYFGGYYFGPITYGGTTIDDNGNGDAMMVSGIDTTFDVSLAAVPSCFESCNGVASAFATGDGPFAFTWLNGSTTPAITGLCPDEYIIEVTDANGQVITDTVVVNEIADPGYTVQQNGSTLSIAGGTAYTWYFNNIPLIGADSSGIEAIASGNYWAFVTTPDGCVFVSDTLNFINVGIGPDPLEDPGIFVFPSPATTHVAVRTTRPIIRLWIVSTLGEISLMRYDGTSSIDVSALAPGLYFLRAESNDGSVAGGTFVKD